MSLMMPFTPHLSHECLELMKSSDYNKWPEIDKKNILREIKLAVQINGKTRDIISIDKDLNASCKSRSSKIFKIKKTSRSLRSKISLL